MSSRSRHTEAGSVKRSWEKHDYQFQELENGIIVKEDETHGEIYVPPDVLKSQLPIPDDADLRNVMPSEPEFGQLRVDEPPVEWVCFAWPKGEYAEPYTTDSDHTDTNIK